MTKKRYHIRAMAGNDAEAVVRLSQLFEPVSTTLWQGIDSEDVLTWLKERISLPQWAGFVAEVEDEIVGFAFCKDMKEGARGFVFPHADETIYLLYLAVDEAFRGQGIAHALLNACEDLAREWGRTGVFLDIADDNPALRLYERLGFERLGAQVFMRKEI
jgi:ribosomal protein S18 acetylase RimI-like enzyme